MFLIWGEGRGVFQGSGRQGGLGGLLTRQVAVCAEGMGSTLLLLPTSRFRSRILKSGRWVFFVSLYLLVQNCPYCMCAQ